MVRVMILAAFLAVALATKTWAADPPAVVPATNPAHDDDYRKWSNQLPFPDGLGGVNHKTFHSKAIGQDVGYSIFRPSQYDAEPDRRFPVIYWLHGIQGDEALGSRRISGFLAKSIQRGEVPPMIMVVANGFRDSFYVDSRDGAVPMETIIIRELIPHIDATYRTIADRSGRGIEGFSMGGYGAMRLGMKYPELFSSAVSLAGAFVDEGTGRSRGGRAFGGDMAYFRQCHPTTLARQNADKVRGRMSVLLACGNQDGLLARNRQFDALLKELRIEHGFTVVPGVGHDATGLYTKLLDATWKVHAKAFERAAKEAATRPAATEPTTTQPAGE